LLIEIILRLKKDLKKAYIYRTIGYLFLLTGLLNDVFYTGINYSIEIIKDLSITFFLLFSFLSFHKTEKIFERCKKTVEKFKK
jgi:hypothetical protein